MKPLTFLGLFLVWALNFAGADPSGPVRWKAVLMTGWATENGTPIDNWENARDGVHALLLDRGVRPGDIRILTARPALVGTPSRGSVLTGASPAGLRDALVSLDLGPSDGLILFLTSHGSRKNGFCLEKEDGKSDYLTPAELALLLGNTVGDRPAVILISACFSGRFLETEGMAGSHRVVLTAARKDRSSFGCGTGAAMPEWDDSLIRVWSALEPGAPWATLIRDLEAAVAVKEQDNEEDRRSYPQGTVGDGVEFFPSLR